jgi:hypothetical protein
VALSVLGLYGFLPLQHAAAETKHATVTKLDVIKWDLRSDSQDGIHDTYLFISINAPFGYWSAGWGVETSQQCQFVSETVTDALGKTVNLGPSASGYSFSTANDYIATVTVGAMCNEYVPDALPPPPKDVAIVSPASPANCGGPGYTVVNTRGLIATLGPAKWYAGPASVPSGQSIVGIATTPDCNGFWILGTDGGIFSYGDAKFYGSTGNLHLNAPAVGMQPTADGKGYWIVTADGGIFSYGDAKFYGSMGMKPLNEPVVGIALDPATGGYWLVARDGGIFSFHAPFFGSTGAIRLNQPIVGMEAAQDGSGYRFVASDGGVFCFHLPFAGSTGGQALSAPIVAMASDGASGYWLLGSNGRIYPFGGASNYGNGP